MLYLTVQTKNLDGIGVLGGNPYNLILWSAFNGTGIQMDLGEYSSYANAKTFAATVFKATLSWDDTAHKSAVFTA